MDLPVPVNSSILRNVFSIIVLSICLTLIESYTPLKIEIPEDGSTLRIFSDDDIMAYDGTNVSKFGLFTFHSDSLSVRHTPGKHVAPIMII